MASNTLLFRCDATLEIGTGHLMRCIALAQAWQDQGGMAHFVLECHSDALLRRLSKEGFEYTRLQPKRTLNQEFETLKATVMLVSPKWVVLDGYRFNADYQASLMPLVPVVSIDDNAHLKEYPARVVLNPNAYSGQLRYPAAAETRLLIGNQFHLLRREFLRAPFPDRTFQKPAEKILVLSGGSDSAKVLPKVFEVLNRIARPLHIKFVFGPDTAEEPNWKKLKQVSRHTVEEIRNSTDMRPLMAWADAAITGAGATTWELAYLGVPMVLLPLYKNQQDTVQFMKAEEASLCLENPAKIDWLNLDRELESFFVNFKKLESYSQKVRALIDGNGPKRIVAALA